MSPSNLHNNFRYGFDEIWVDDHVIFSFYHRSFIFYMFHNLYYLKQKL